MLKAAFSAAVLACTLAFAAHAATPIEAFGQLPAVSSVKISRDGQSLAYIRNSEGKRHVVVQALNGDIIAMTDVGIAKVRSVAWGDADHVVVTTTVAGVIDDNWFVAIKGERYAIYSFNIRSKKTVRLMERSSEEALNTALSSVQPGTYKGKSVGYLMGYTIAGGGRVDLYRVDLESGLGTIHQMGSDEFSDFVISREGQLAARTFDGRQGRWRMEVSTDGKTWVPAGNMGTGTLDSPGLVGYGRTLDTVLTYNKNDAADRWDLVEVDRATGKTGEKIGLNRPVESIIYAQDGHLAGLAYSDPYPDYKFYDPKLTEAWALVSQAFDGKIVHLASWSDDFSKLIIQVEGAGDAGSWYVIDPAAKSAKRVGTTYPALAPQDVSEVRLVRYKAADGLALTGYLTLPSGKDPKNLPLIVLPHGGPQASDDIGFDWWSQAMASRGYAVFQPQFRGSEGFGNAFVNAGHGQIGRKMQTDITDGVKVLARTGMVDSKRACIIGASYGGYAALAGVTIEQGLYRCAVAVAPVSDWGRMMSNDAITGSGSKGTTVSYWKRFTGAASTSDPMLDTISPARLAARADAPILMIHGRDDTVVPFEQTDVMIKALKAAGKPVDLVTLAAEDHWLSREATRIQMLKATIDFVEKYNPPN